MKRAAVALVVAGLPLAAGCAVGPGPARPAPAVTPATTAAFNATDVMFAQMMLAHHAQGRRIVRLAGSRPVRAEVRTLAAAIEVTEAAEAETMAGWLRAWRQPMTADPGAHAGHGGAHGTSAADIAALEKTPAADFERAFLNLMVSHQHGAIEIARMETAGGADPRAADLARRIAQSRTAEITQMLGHLG